MRSIGRWSFAALTVNCIVGSGVFGLPSALAEKAGRASILGVVVAGAIMTLIMGCFAEVASRFTETGGPYLYAQKAFGRFMGIQVAWLVWFVRLTACAANANLFVTYLGEFWAPATRTQSKLLILALLVGMLAAINFLGVKAGTRVSTTFTVAKLASLGTVCLAGAFYIFLSGRFIPEQMPLGNQTSWVQAVVLLIFAYGGFEAALISTGELKNPRSDLPFGLFAAVITCTVLYGVVQWVVVTALPDPAHSQRPLADVAGIALGPVGAVVVAAGALLSVYGYLSANILATPRITFALAERGDFPRAFALLHRKFRTPYFSIFIFGALVWIFAFVGNFTWNVTLSAGSRLFYYGVVCAALPVLRRRQSGSAAFHVPGGTATAIAGLLVCLILLTRIDYSKSLFLAAAFGIAAFNWLLVRKQAGKTTEDSVTASGGDQS
jgi:APA family basic amino acid/polyamine antiporter